MRCNTCDCDFWPGNSSETCPECLQIIIANSVPEADDEEDAPVCIDCGRPVDPEVMTCEACFAKDFPAEDQKESDE